MSTLHVLLPPLAKLGGDPALRRWLAQGDRLPDVPHTRTTALRELFHFAGDAIPAAALRHLCHADDAHLGAWLCADPAWVRSEATGARLMAWPLDDITQDEAVQLAAAVKPLCGDAGAPLSVDTPAAWCMQLAATPQGTFVEPGDALGADLIECLPGGDAGRSWRRLFNEVQIALHTHPVNAARVAAGKRPVNALWFWGAGALPGAVETGVQTVASVDDALRGLAKLGGAVRLEPLLDSIEEHHRAGDVLLDLDIPGHADEMAAWFAHFKRWLRERRFDALALDFASGERFRLRHAHRLRFWRRP
ncbi:MAG: phosphoglycerate mutase [Rhodanobacteraceae bacterium]|nr:MAG: phosphoglycerate mutase [Rhodanobacteraceae bacterium]